MKLYFLTLDIFGMGGTIRTVLNVANYLAENNYDVEIISVMKHTKKSFFEINPKINIKVLYDKTEKIEDKRIKKDSKLLNPEDEAIKLFSQYTDFKMIEYLKGIKVGILISTRPSFNIFVTKYVNENVIKIGQEHLNLGVYSNKLQKQMIKYYPKLDYLATLTDDDTEDYRQIFQNKNLKIIKLTNSIPEFESRRSKLTYKSILAAGRLVPQKGFDLLIEAFSKIVTEVPDWKIKIYGSGKDKRLLQELINEKRLYNEVLLMGPTEKIEKEMEKSSIFILSSRYEGFGMVIVEAMKCGLPVISFDCPKGPSEIITDGVDGILVDNGNIDEMSKKMLKLIKDAEKRKELAENAIKNVERYSIKNIGEKWMEVISEIEDKELHTINI